MSTITPLTTKEKVTCFLSLQGVIAFSDHEDCGVEDDKVIEAAIRRASGELAGYIYPTYRVESIANCEMVCEWATQVAAFYLAKTRGNNPPEALYDCYSKIMDKPDGLVWDLRRGDFLLPGVPKQDYDTPTFSNLQVDRRFRRNKVRVKPQNSSRVQSELEQDEAIDSGARY